MWGTVAANTTTSDTFTFPLAFNELKNYSIITMNGSLPTAVSAYAETNRLLGLLAWNVTSNVRVYPLFRINAFGS